MKQDITLNSDAFSQIYTGNYDWLVKWLNRRLHCKHSSADLAQDTFVRLLCKDGTMAIQEPRALLTTVAKGLLSNHYRRNQLERHYLEALSTLPEQELPSLETRAILLETLIEIDRLLDGLPALVRRAFLLSQVDGLRQSEIAQELGVSIPTVKRYIVRAVQQCCFID